MAEDSRENSLSVFFPCYNEQDNIRRVYESARKVLGSLGIDHEMIFVNDGSKDRTGEIADAIAAGDPRVKVVHHPVNRGYGSALQSGFRAATKRLVFYTDGDGQFDIGEMPPLLPLMKECDIVSCYRINRQDNFIRKVNAWCWTKLVCLVFGMRLRDIDCAFKLYRREIFDTIEMKSTGALIDTEILARAIRKGYTVRQVGVRHYPRITGVPTGAKLSVIIRAFRELFVLHRQISGKP
ncbi:MAG TPA: glycosyltransferase family 2 protein [Sedimentisphaerales bacterium]|nr:glycosyltransferase family 2 protein [Sedimentisphaerales bacterium]